MRPARLLAVLAAATGLVTVGGAAHGIEAPKKPKAEIADEELLEFLGSIDDSENDSAWYEWLTRDDPAKSNRAKQVPKKTT